MKLPKLLRRKKLRATAGRASLRASAQTDYEEMSEPNMKLSRALLIVLLLHVVAVVVQKDSAPAKQASKDGAKPKQSVNAKGTDAGKVYVVAKGDNPVTIAKKFKVSYDDLIALNHIEDPRKLQIGQKLLIPKTIKPRKSDE